MLTWGKAGLAQCLAPSRHFIDSAGWRGRWWWLRTDEVVKDRDTCPGTWGGGLRRAGTAGGWGMGLRKERLEYVWGANEKEMVRIKPASLRGDADTSPAMTQRKRYRGSQGACCLVTGSQHSCREIFSLKWSEVTC